MDRRDFLTTGGAIGLASSGVLAAVPATAAQPGPAFSARPASPDVAVIGAGAFGGWTALYLREPGIRWR